MIYTGVLLSCEKGTEKLFIVIIDFVYNRIPVASSTDNLFQLKSVSSQCPSGTHSLAHLCS